MSSIVDFSNPCNPAAADPGGPEHREIQLTRVEAQTRRHFLGTCATGLGAMFMATLAPASRAAGTGGVQRLDFTRDASNPLSPLPPQFAPKARRVIYIHMNGAPSQLELFDHKPELVKFDGKDCPAHFLAGKRFAFIS